MAFDHTNKNLEGTRVHT